LWAGIRQQGAGVLLADYGSIRIADYEKITARVRPFVKQDLKTVRRAVAELMDEPLPNQDDIVAALIHAATAAKLASALRAYWKVSKPWEDEDSPGR
jgi:hypothetical protein